jgi:hypothetical protein
MHAPALADTGSTAHMNTSTGRHLLSVSKHVPVWQGQRAAQQRINVSHVPAKTAVGNSCKQPQGCRQPRQLSPAAACIYSGAMQQKVRDVVLL